MTAPATGSRSAARIEMPEPLRADVRLLGTVLGEVLQEYGGGRLLESVERLRQLTIAAHADPAHGDPEDGDGTDPDTALEDAVRLVEGWDVETAVDVARAFSVYFHLVNLAEQQHRVRSLRERDTSDRPAKDSIAGAVAEVAELSGTDRAQQMLDALEFRPVLTAHPTEARRRAVATGIRRIALLLGQNDDPRLSATERSELDRRLHEEVDVLWRTAQLRDRPPEVLDEVRTAMAVFDDVLFRVVPQIYRQADDALSGADAGRVPSRVPPFVRFGSWIGGDRDGNPNVTARVTRETLAVQADHVLRALEAACTRIGRTLTADVATTPPSAALLTMLKRARSLDPGRFEALETRSPAEPHRVALLAIGGRIAATRQRDADAAYPGPGALLADLRTVQESLVAAGAPRLAYGEVQHLVWQVQTFGFHLAELEVRQHSAVHAAALAELRDGTEPSAQTEEVLETLRVVAHLQRRYGVDACRRYVVSFTRSADDLAAVHELAGYALGDEPVELDVVPLFETGADLENAVQVLDDALALETVQQRLAATGRRMEIMLGYSDSAKDVGPVSATLGLYAAQARLTEWAAKNDIALTMFHGRGGALGRGGGPANRAVLAQAPGSVAGRFKVTEQGEVIFARYGDPDIARRHVEQVASAVLRASSPAIAERASAAAERFADLAARLDPAAREAYHALVRAEGFAAWFATVTPMEELGRMGLGSRPAKRGLSTSSLDDLRAIPWVFSWSQVRVNLPGWYGLGSGLAAVGDLDLLRSAYAEWPLFTVMLENAEMSLAKTDRRIAARFLALGNRPDLVERVLAEHALTTERVLEVTGHRRLLEDRRVLSRAVALRNPYVDALSLLQVRALGALRDGTERPNAEVERLRGLLLLSAGGVAAGLQNTG